MPRWQHISYSVVVIELIEKVHPGGGEFWASQIFVWIYRTFNLSLILIIFIHDIFSSQIYNFFIFDFYLKTDFLNINPPFISELKANQTPKKCIHVCLIQRVSRKNVYVYKIAIKCIILGLICLSLLWLLNLYIH